MMDFAVFASLARWMTPTLVVIVMTALAHECKMHITSPGISRTLEITKCPRPCNHNVPMMMVWTTMDYTHTLLEP
jgi:hypothetical protein